MKIFTVLVGFLLLSACSTTETTPVESDAMVLPEGASGPTINPDTFLASEEKLATPVEPASKTSDSALSDPTPPAPPGPPPLPESLPAPRAEAQASPPPVVESSTPASAGRNTRQDFNEYRDRAKTRAEVEDEIEQRSLFAHEDGAFQLGFDYGRNAFSGLDLKPGTAVITPGNQGGQISYTYFPLHSLDLGRLGVGLNAGAYWVKHEYTGTTGAAEKSNKLGLQAIGAKLRYEFSYWIGQMFVPFVEFGYQRVNVKSFSRTAAGYVIPAAHLGGQSYGGGLAFNLNRLEHSAASKALASTGIRKTFLAYTFQGNAGELSGNSSHFLGLRFEY